MPHGAQEVVVQVASCLLDRDFVVAVTAAAIALLGVVIGGLLDHLLLLRTDRIKRERDRAARRFEAWTEGVRPSINIHDLPDPIPGIDDIEIEE